MSHIEVKYEKISVTDEKGQPTYLSVKRTYAHEQTLDGVQTWEKLAELSTQDNVHVNRVSDTEFEDLRGRKYKAQSR